jgi:hypothetical protein
MKCSSLWLSCLVPDPEGDQATEVRDEPLLLVRRIRRGDRVRPVTRQNTHHLTSAFIAQGK